MEDHEIRLECLRLATGDQRQAQEFYAWVKDVVLPTPETQLALSAIESELFRLTGKAWTVTGGKDGLYRVGNELQATAVRFTVSDLAMSLQDFSEKVLQPLLETFNN